MSLADRDYFQAHLARDIGSFVGEVLMPRLGDSEPLDPIDFVRTIAVARITMPRSFVRLAAGRSNMSDETQALCLLAGANSIFFGTTKLLTTSNPTATHDEKLLEKLGVRAMQI